MIKLALLAPADPLAVAEWLQRHGWALDQHHPADATRGDETIWTHAAEATVVHCVEDRFVGQTWVALVGGDGSGLQARLAAALPLIDLAGALELPRRAGEAASATALARVLAVLAPERYDDLVMHALADLLQQGDAGVRREALQALAAIGWIELRPLVTAVMVADPDAGVREEAARVLRAFEQVHGRGSDPS